MQASEWFLWVISYLCLELIQEAEKQMSHGRSAASGKVSNQTPLVINLYSVCVTWIDADKRKSQEWSLFMAVFLSGGTPTILDLSLGIPSHFCNICQGIYQFVPFPTVQCCLSCWSCHCSFTTLLGWRALPILVMPLDIVSKYLANVFSCHLIQVYQGPLLWNVVSDLLGWKAS